MVNYQLPHHQAIASALAQFDNDYLTQHNILFGGGTRIALELGEYRESVDIDFLCPSKEAFRAVRNQVSSNSLGRLVSHDFNYQRDISWDRYAVRTFIEYDETRLKLEFVSFDNYELVKEASSPFPVPCIDKTSCFYTKLLANSDRGLSFPYKDIIDILMMYKHWQGLPQKAIELAESHYSVIPQLIRSLEDIVNFPDKYQQLATGLKMQDELMSELIFKQAPNLLNYCRQRSL